MAHIIASVAAVQRLPVHDDGGRIGDTPWKVDFLKIKFKKRHPLAVRPVKEQTRIALPCGVCFI